MATVIKKSPSVVPGFGATEHMRDGLRCEKFTVNSSDTSPVTIFQVPTDTLVFGAALNLSGAWASSDASALSLKVGDATVTNRFLSVGTAYLASTSTWICDWKGYEYSTDADIICTITGTPSSLSAVTADIWLFFRTDSTKQIV